MKFSPVLFFVFAICTCAAQPKLNRKLKQQLDSVYALDQKYRAMITLMSSPGVADTMAKKLTVSLQQAMGMLQNEQQHLDSMNFIFVKRLMDNYGYPGKTLVGDTTSQVAWNVIDHANKITEYLPVVKLAAEAKEIPFYLYATMLDRYLANDGRPQIYGSQCTCGILKTGIRACFVWPVENPLTVNEQRKKAGFKITIEQNAERFGIRYRALKLEYIQLPLSN